PLERVMAEPRPWVGLAADAGEVAGRLRRLELLEAAGLETEWRQEDDAAVRAYAARAAALLALAEGISERGYPLEVIRVGYQLLRQREGQWDERLLRLVFPFPYREVLEREADRYDVDPMLLAGLVRQESTF